MCFGPASYVLLLFGANSKSLNGMLTLLEGSSEDLPIEAMRDYLNGLVEESVSRKSEQVRSVLRRRVHLTAP